MSLFGGNQLFGAAQSTSLTNPTTSTAFAGFGFGANTSVQGTNLFQSNVAKPAVSTNLFGSLGQQTTVSPFASLGATAPKTTGSMFPSLFTAGATQSTGIFGTQPTIGLGSTFKPVQPAAGSLFAPQGVQTLALQQQQQQQQQAPQQNNLDAFFTSLCQPLLFGDERDTILARWNQLQAMWGIGMGFSAAGVATYTAENTFARFKAIAYNLLPTSSDSDGLICIYLARPFSEVIPQRQGLQDMLFRLLGGRPNLQLVVEEIRPSSEKENQTEVILKVVERQATGNVTNVSASELEKYLSSPSVAPQLSSQLFACKINSEVRPSGAQLAVYKENPPAGIDRLIWQQACTENPHPERTVPVPLIGFNDLRRRRLDQVAFSKQQSATLKQIGDVVKEMKGGQLAIAQKVAQLKRKQIEISHRVLKVLRRQETHRRSGFAISAEEEVLRCGLERLWADLISPRGLRVRFQEALSTLRSSSDKENAVGGTDRGVLGTGEDQSGWQMDSESWNELREYLSQRQSGIRELQQLLTEMSATLKIIEEVPMGANIPPGTPAALPMLLRPHRTTPNKVAFALSSRSR